MAWLVCDFCEEDSEIATFDPEWDAVICDKCEKALEEEWQRIKLKYKREVIHGNYSENGT